MQDVFLVIHLLLVLAMIGVVLLQKSEGGGLGIGGGGGGGGSGGMGGFLSGRGSANLLTRATAVLAGLFMISSLGLTILANQGIDHGGSIVDDLRSQPIAPIQAPVEPLAPPVPQN